MIIPIHFTFVYFVSRQLFTFPRYELKKRYLYTSSSWSILIPIIIINTRVFFLAHHNSINYLEFDLHCRCGRSLAVIIDFARPRGKCGITAWLEDIPLLRTSGNWKFEFDSIVREVTTSSTTITYYTCSTLDRVIESYANSPRFPTSVGRGFPLEFSPETTKRFQVSPSTRLETFFSFLPHR